MSLRSNVVICALMCGAVGVVAYSAGYSQGEEKKGAPRVYELRTYTTEPGRLPALHARFRDHTIKLFEKHGMQNGMYWVPTDEKLKDNTLIYVVSHASREAADKSWAAFINDPEWIKARDASEKDGKIVAKVERQYMVLTDYSPVTK
jgi:hypothetical protein